MDKPPDPRSWEHNALAAFPKQNGTKWQAWITGFLSFLCGVLSAAFLLGGKSRDISDLLNRQSSIDARFEAIATRFERMEREGTNRSHWVDDAQSNAIAANLAKITELERRTEARGEQINVMAGKIERLERELEIKHPK